MKGGAKDPWISHLSPEPGLDLLKFVKEKKELQESMKHTSLGMFD
jgi:hypothetical protein